MQGMTAPYTTAPSHSPAGRSARADWPRMAGWLVVAALLTVAGLALALRELLALAAQHEQGGRTSH